MAAALLIGKQLLEGLEIWGNKKFPFNCSLISSFLLHIIIVHVLCLGCLVRYCRAMLSNVMLTLCSFSDSDMFSKKYIDPLIFFETEAIQIVTT